MNIIQYVRNLFLIGWGAIVGYHAAESLDYTQICLGIVLIALGASLLFSQFTMEDTVGVSRSQIITGL